MLRFATDLPDAVVGIPPVGGGLLNQTEEDGPQRFGKLVTGFGDRCDFFIASANRPIFFERLMTAHEEHELIIKAIESGDAKGGAAIMRGHILAIEKRLREPSLESVE